MNLHELGWPADVDPCAIQLAAGERIARVTVEHRNGYRLHSELGTLAAEVSGRLRHDAELGLPPGLPAVGDWVVMIPAAASGVATIRAVLPRTSQFTRKAAGRVSVPQIIAANVDLVFLVSALNGELNPRRLERYLTLAWECGTRPVIVLNKADLCPDCAAELERVRAVAHDVPIHLVSAASGSGLRELENYFKGQRTVALLGSSGVGKSTLINGLLGRQSQPTQDLREDGKGRHTTTRRELLLRPGGGLIVDTPGMRELQLWEGSDGLDTAFAEVEDLATRCRFRDCAHADEPGCSVRQAIREGTLPPERLASYRKLLGEVRHLEEKHDDRARAERKREEKRLHRGLYKRLDQKRTF